MDVKTMRNSPRKAEYRKLWKDLPAKSINNCMRKQPKEAAL